ncbi:ABC transporter permease [Fulvivirga sediminis]|uniref:ABC transporter permease n=1 Tax=Fulvivirga sediminis TaxID=2803949 RepID=A0A937FD57_9BACT|nr:ABC transporter permease [Fulvivirga sediminis]MBL3659039.1 ABC transporter permease [Fulvivirga sediminis]
MLNLIGLVGGTFAAFVIAKYVGYSLSYDDFHTNKNNIYVIWQREISNMGAVTEGTKTFWNTAEIIKSDYTEVLETTRIHPNPETLVLSETNNQNFIKFNELNILSVDSNFFKIFSYEFIHGNERKALSQRSAIVLTKSAANKYYKNENPIGQVLSLKTSWGDQMDAIVSAVIEDNPRNSNIHFDFLLVNQKPNTNQYWQNADYETYILLKPEVSHKHFAKKLASDISYRGGLNTQGRNIEMAFIPITKLQISITDYILSIVGVVILIVSWINFISISSVQNLIKTKEVAVKKIMGASKQHIFIQLFTEALLINGLGIACVAILYFVFEKHLKDITHGHLLPFINESWNINLIFLSIFAAGTLISSILPAISLTSQNLSNSLRGDTAAIFRNLGLRKVLVVMQFSISTILIMGIVVITKQLNFIKDYDKGIDFSRTLIIKAPKDGWDGKQERLNSFKQQCRELSVVKEVSSSTTVPGETYRQEISIEVAPGQRNHKSILFTNGIDEKYLELYDIEFLEGENFKEDAPWKNKRGAILNETAIKAIGIENIKDAIGTKLYDSEAEKDYELIGVVKDYHKVSLKSNIEPTIFLYNNNRGSFSIKLNNSSSKETASIHEALEPLNDLWERLYTNQPFDYYLLEERFYETDLQEYNFARFFKIFTALSIIISCLGLYSLVLFLINKRMKEVGIRKIFGAGSIQVFAFLLKDYAVQLLLSLIIGIPIAYYLMSSWLSGYSYHIKLGVWIIPYGIIPLILIFLATVFYQVLKVAKMNPVKIFRQD